MNKNDKWNNIEINNNNENENEVITSVIDDWYYIYSKDIISFNYSYNWNILSEDILDYDTYSIKKISVSTDNINTGYNSFLKKDFIGSIWVEISYWTTEEYLNMPCWMCFWKRKNLTFQNPKWEKIYVKIDIHELNWQVCLECLEDENFRKDIKKYNDQYFEEIEKLVGSIKIKWYSLYNKSDYSDL